VLPSSLGSLNCIYLLEPLCMPSLASPTFQGKLLAAEANASKRISSVVVSPDDCRIAVGCGLQIDHMCWYLRQHLLPCEMLSSTLEPLPFHSTV